MIKPKIYHIALGSNQGDKFENLQEATNIIFKKIGHIRAISTVYQTPAFGFKGQDFLNCCIALESNLFPQEVLDVLLRIEITLGRQRRESAGYEDRPIDLDIIFTEDKIIDTEALQVPHPEMEKRKFVLQPLKDIAADFVHPKLNQKVSELLAACKDESNLEPLNRGLDNPYDAFDFSSLNYIAIEGNIGAGKTSLATKLAHDFNARLILERFADNPFLPKFYEDANRYAFTLEMSFLADRYQQISDDLSQLDLFKDFVVSDYDVFKSLIFSKITLNKDEFSLYRKLFYLMYKDIPKPELYVYLYQSTERLQQNIQKRGRDYEQNIANDYLEKINSGYLEFLKTQKDFNVRIIDVSDKDFVDNREDYLWVIGEILN